MTKIIQTRTGNRSARADAVLRALIAHGRDLILDESVPDADAAAKAVAESVWGRNKLAELQALAVAPTVDELAVLIVAAVERHEQTQAS